MTILTIGLCGQVSAGKTSFLCSLVGGFIGSVSLLRETIKAELFQLRINADFNHNIYEKETLELKKNIENNMYDVNSNISTDIFVRNPDFPLPSFLRKDINIIDFPGINDSADKDGKFLNILFQNLDKLDILIYLTSAETAFTLASETKIFNDIKAKVEEWNKKGNYIHLIIVINKMDNPSDSEINRIIKCISDELKEANKFFRISSHKLFLHTLKINNIRRVIPKDLMNEFIKILNHANVIINSDLASRLKNEQEIDFSSITYNSSIFDERSDESGDWDNLIYFLQNFNHNLYRNESMFNFINNLGIDDINLIMRSVKRVYDVIDYNENKTIIKFTDMIYRFYQLYSKSDEPTKFISIFNLIDKLKISIIQRIFDFKIEKRISQIMFILFCENIQYFNNNECKHIVLVFLKSSAFWVSPFSVQYSRFYIDQPNNLICLDYYKRLNINGKYFNWFISKIYYEIPDFQGIIKLSSLNYPELFILHKFNPEKIKELMYGFPKLYNSLISRACSSDIYIRGPSTTDEKLNYHIFTDVVEKFYVDLA